MAQIPGSIGQKWPSLADQFPAGAEYTDTNAIIWADAGARYAAEGTDRILAAIGNLAAAVADLATHVNQLSAGGNADPAAVASAIVSHIHVA